MNSDNDSVIDIHFEVTLVHAYYLAIIMIDDLGLLNTKLMQITLLFTINIMIICY